MSATLPSSTDPSVPIDFGNGRKTSTRRQWSVQGGPRGLLRRMRSQLAEDGCPESQLVMGRTLLQQLEEANEIDEEDARLAVFWLNQSSLQGNKEATELLQDCLDRNIGICEHNYREIRECLSMDLQEKLVRRAAHLLFCSLSDGNDFINGGSLSIKIQNIASGKEDDKPIDVQENGGKSINSLEERFGGERFTEDHLVSAAVFYCEGRVPPLHHYVTLVPRGDRGDQFQIYKAVRLPFKLAVDVYQCGLHFLGVVLTNFLLRMLFLTNPLPNVAILCLIATLILLLGTTQAHVILPVFVSGVALSVMMISSAHMLLVRKRFDSFRIWSLVFSHYCPEIDTVEMEKKFKSRQWKPYMTMFLALLFFLGTVPLTSSKLFIDFLPALYAFSMLTFFLVPEKLAFWQFVSLTLHLSVVTPEVYNVVNLYLVSFIKDTGIEEIFPTHHFMLWETVRLNLGIASFLHLIWCIGCLGIWITDGLTSLLPHLVSLTWCHLAVMATQAVKDPNTLTNTFAVWAVLVILPFFTPLILMTLPGLLIASLCLQLGCQLYMAALVLVSCLALTLLLKYCYPTFSLVFKVVLCGGILIGLLHSSSVQNLPTVRLSNIQWDNYKNVCWPSKDTGDTGAVTMHRCSILQGTFVKWEGSISQVQIASVWNLPQTVFSILPEVIEKPLRCHIGRQIQPCRGVSDESDHCHFIQTALGSFTCSLDNWNEYTFEISVAMSLSSWKFGTGTSLIRLHADNSFREFALGLHLGDEIEFIGSLSQDIGLQNPKLELLSISCKNCKKRLQPSRKNIATSQFDPWLVPTFIFNFLMGPILSI